MSKKDSSDDYWTKVLDSYPVLSEEETDRLTALYAKTKRKSIADHLVASNMRLVFMAARGFARKNKQLIQDLVQEGAIGLMRGVEKYDLSRKIKLSSYVIYWIRAYMLRFLMNDSRLVKLGTTQVQRRLFFNLKKKKAELEKQGLSGTAEEIAEAMGVPAKEVADMALRLGYEDISFDAPLGDGSERTRFDVTPDSSADADQSLTGKEYRRTIHGSLDRFRSSLQKRVDLALFDLRILPELMEEKPLSMDEIAMRFGHGYETMRRKEQHLRLYFREYMRKSSAA